MAAGVIVRVVFNQAVFIHSLLVAFDHPVNRAFAIHYIVKGFFGDFSDGDILVIKDAIPFFGHFNHIIIALYFGVHQCGVFNACVHFPTLIVQMQLS